MMRVIPTIKDYKEYKIDLFGNSSDGENQFDKLYANYLKLDWEFSEGKSRKDKLLKIKNDLNSFEPKYLDWVYVKRFIQKMDRLIYELENKHKKYYQPYTFEDLKEKLLDKETINDLYDTWKGNIPTRISMILSLNKTFSKRKKSLRKKIMDISGIIGIYFGLVGITILVLKFIGLM